MPFISSLAISLYNSIRGGGAAGEAGALLLDLYPNASAAYSLRKLKTDYTGFAIRVRETGLGEEADIGFDANGNLDTAALIAHCGTSNGFVTTWYDQSGNANDATNATDTEQPRIVLAGSVITENGKPATTWFSQSQLGTTRIPYSNLSIFSIQRSTSVNTNNNAVISQENGFLQKSAQAPTSYPRFQVHDGGFKTAEFETDMTNTHLIQTGITDNGVARIFINGNAGNTIAYGTLSNPLADFNIGRYASVASSSHLGTIQEIVLYTSNEISNRAGIESNINQNYNIYWDGSQTGLLDDYPNAAAAYSLRALNSAYTGALVRVRRSSDSAEKDIYALYDGSLDTEGLLNFVGAGNGFVTTWYDQSGNANNYTQTGEGNQPLIVFDGNFILANGKTSIRFNIDDAMSNTLPVTDNGEIYLSLVATIDSGQTDKQLFNIGGTNGVDNILIANTVGRTTPDSFAFVYQDSITEIETVSGIHPTGSPMLLTMGYSSSIFQYINGVESTGSGAGESRVNYNDNYIGGRTPTAFSVAGNFQEFIVYDSDQSSNREGIETSINTSYNIYWEGSQTGILDIYSDSINRAPKAVKLDGVDDYLTFTELRSTTATFSIWFKSPVLTSSNLYQFAREAAGTGQYFIRTLGLSNSVSFRSAASASFSFADSFVDNEWTHLFISCDGTNVRAFINGVESTSGELPIANLLIFDAIGIYAGTAPSNMEVRGVLVTDTASLNPQADATAIYNEGVEGSALEVIPAAQQYYSFNNTTKNEGSLGGTITFNNTKVYPYIQLYPDSSAAYSLRALSSEYTGPLARVRRSSDDAEQDIYALYDGTLDTESLLNFVGIGGTDNGFVSAWYDQSGSGVDMTQTTIGLQPQIVSAGTLNTLNNKPSVVFDGTVGLTNASSLTYTDGVYFFGALSVSILSATSRIISDDITGVQGNFIIPTSNTLSINDNGTGFKTTTLTSLSNSTQSSYAVLFDQSTGNFESYANASSNSGTVAAWTGPIAPSGAANLGLGSSGNNAQFLVGEIQEAIIYTSNQVANREGIRANINTNYNIY